MDHKPVDHNPVNHNPAETFRSEMRASFGFPVEEAGLRGPAAADARADARPGGAAPIRNGAARGAGVAAAYFSSTVARAASSRAMGTRNGEQDT